MVIDTPSQLEQTLRRIIQEEVQIIVRRDVRTIIREETQDIRDDVAVIRQVQYAQSSQLQSLQVDVRSIKTSVQTNGLLLEDLESRFSASYEANGL